MKKGLYILAIFICAVIISHLTDTMVSNTYKICDDIVETDKFRYLNIDAESITNAHKLSEKNNVDFSKILASKFLINNLNMEDVKIVLNEYKRLDKNYRKADKEEYSKVCKAMSAVFDDLEYFPVAKSSVSDYWVTYEDSFGADRNYNGEYKHEGTDLMAVNNVSGYYPIVSVTDGEVENIGWLEKGGYRIGIRAKSGGYFYYAHLSSYSDLKKGDKVKAGTLLGYMGDTGYGKAEGTSGNFDVHLHFGIYIQTENYAELSVNPYNILKYLEDKLIIANY